MIITKLIEGEIELNRAWVYDNPDDDPIGETNFAVKEDFVKKIYNEDFADRYSSYELFLDAYEPETDGEHIYQRAIKENELIQDLGECIYGTIKCL